MCETVQCTCVLLYTFAPAYTARGDHCMSGTCAQREHTSVRAAHDIHTHKQTYPQDTFLGQPDMAGWIRTQGPPPDRLEALLHKGVPERLRGRDPFAGVHHERPLQQLAQLVHLGTAPSGHWPI